MSLCVLHVAQPTEGGVARVVAGVAGDQRSRGWRVLVACPPGGQLGDELAALGVPRVPWPATRAPGFATAAEVARLAALVRAVEPDVVHLHSAKAGLAGRLAVRGRRPTLFQPHGWSWLAVRGLTARAALRWERHAAARWTSAVVCVGAGEDEHARRSRVGGRRVVVPLGVDLTRFAPPGSHIRAAARAGLGVSADAALVLCLGRVTRQKGQDVLLAAWPRVRARCPGAELAVVGDGALLPALRAHAAGAYQARGVRFIPQVRDPRSWYAAADVVVLPSRWEGLSLVLLEALASGCPVVASDIPGLAEAVPADAGALVPAGDAAALACALADQLTVAADPDRRAACRGAARRGAERFDLRRGHDRLAALTRQVALAGLTRRVALAGADQPGRRPHHPIVTRGRADDVPRLPPMTDAAARAGWDRLLAPRQGDRPAQG